MYNIFQDGGCPGMGKKQEPVTYSVGGGSQLLEINDEPAKPIESLFKNTFRHYTPWMVGPFKDTPAYSGKVLKDNN